MRTYRLILFFSISFCFMYLAGKSQKKILLVRGNDFHNENITYINKTIEALFQKKFTISNNAKIGAYEYQNMKSVPGNPLQNLAKREDIRIIITLEVTNPNGIDGISTLSATLYELNQEGVMQGKKLNRFSFPMNKNFLNKPNDIQDMGEYLAEKCYCFINQVKKTEIIFRSDAADEYMQSLNQFVYRPLKDNPNLCTKYILKLPSYQPMESIDNCYIEGEIKESGELYNIMLKAQKKGTTQSFASNKPVKKVEIPKSLQDYRLSLISFLLNNQ